MATTQQLMDAVEAILRDGRPMHVIMRSNEEAAGYRIVVPGDEPWLSADDWHETVTVSVDGTTVRLVAILAMRPNAGALRRTIRGIMDAGLVPCVIAPNREMRSTMQRWKWSMRRVGSGMDAEEQWSPRKTWKPHW